MRGAITRSCFWSLLLLTGRKSTWGGETREVEGAPEYLDRQQWRMTFLFRRVELGGVEWNEKVQLDGVRFESRAGK